MLLMLQLAEGAAGWIMLYNEIGKFVKLFFGLCHKFFYRSFIFAGIAVIILLSALGFIVLSESYICEYCSSKIISGMCHNYFTGV